MTAVASTAFLALWNDVDPACGPEYEAWHAQEHVPERVALPGFVFGRRYVATDAAPRYFTLYGLESLAALRSAAYADVVEHPTAWSRRMRGAFRNFRRLACMVGARRGRTAGKALATLVVSAGARCPDRNVLDAMAAATMAALDVVAVTLGVADDDAYPLASALAAQAGTTGSHVALVEAGNAAQALAAADVLEAAWRRRDTTVALRGAYALTQAVTHDAVATPDGARRVPRDDLRLKWERG